MKPTTYINWDGLKDIPFFYCDTKEDEENKDFDIYYQASWCCMTTTIADTTFTLLRCCSVKSETLQPTG